METIAWSTLAVVVFGVLVICWIVFKLICWIYRKLTRNTRPVETTSIIGEVAEAVADVISALD